ncbi:hypothetical protein KXV70_003735 [Aspergillus fumigatus]|nr:hypothetical protein KXX63_004721 [Aspergillus fumigatus]KAH1371968.1 hypothetical protein KXX50_004770 [Aspergillus fumigatus]KAH1380244.1 hypothetical protein KXX49_006502 [Aspergillus fumigatus]KAH1415784.1 hypothetical protein KXX64_005674 [Aspergillus fumigatus]KAH1417995.1 hypothetical protein KXX32_009307 [Aspergillus fumigatus]
MPSAMKIERVIHRLQKELNTLNGIDGLELDLAQNDGVETCRKQLLEDDSLEKRRRSERKKAKILLSKIYNVSPVLFVLFIISIPTYQWHLLEEKSTVPALRNWMESVTIPDRLRNEARKICDGFFDRLLNSKKTESVFDISLRDVLCFLQSRPESNTMVQLRCTLSGTPLPHINFDMQQTLGLIGSLEFSLELCEAIFRSSQAQSVAAESRRL